MSVPPRIFQFKITLARIRPPIWRRIQVPENYTFRQFHRAIVCAMGWEDYHLHKFCSGMDEDIGVLFPGDDPDELETIDETTVVLNQYFNEPNDFMKYEYDFGACWSHEILLEEILPADDSKEYPICEGGKRACPPEDCKGYEYFLEILNDPDHEEHEERKNWLKEIYGTAEWDAEKFDPKEVVFKVDEPPLYL